MNVFAVAVKPDRICFFTSAQFSKVAARCEVFQKSLRLVNSKAILGVHLHTSKILENISKSSA